MTTVTAASGAGHFASLQACSQAEEPPPSLFLRGSDSESLRGSDLPVLLQAGAASDWLQHPVHFSNSLSSG